MVFSLLKLSWGGDREFSLVPGIWGSREVRGFCQTHSSDKRACAQQVERLGESVNPVLSQGV